MWLLSVALVVWGVCYLRDDAAPADRIRWVGMLLQLLGVGTVAWGIKRSRELFDHEPVLKVLAERVRRFGLLLGCVRGKGAGEEMPNSKAVIVFETEATATVRRGRSLEDRVKELEDDVRLLRGKLTEERKQRTKLLDDVRSRLSKEAGERKKAVKELRAVIENATAGGVVLELAGVAYLVLGIVMATAPGWTATVVEWLCGA